MRSTLLTLLALASTVLAQAQLPDSLTGGLTRVEGLLPYYYDAAKDRILVEVRPDLGDVIYVESLASGVGSNDLGLDRGQLGDTRLVRFRRAGKKLLLVQPNQDYRARSDNAAERASVAEAFAESVLWGFPILYTRRDSSVLIDVAPFLLQDAHGVARTLSQNDQGTFKVDPLRSALYLERTRNFPRNTEFEATITLVGEAKGRELRSVTPTPDAVTTRQHHSFVALPEPGYEPRAFDPRAGYFPLSFADYATPIGAPLVTRYIRRHRLAPGDTLVYYVDRGAPEPVRSALIEGASWWADAFAAAGFPEAFRVEVLPEGVDPLDVRYNVIQWVHRSTRGWSYGASVTDPRTGEILKGHVSLGSLRVRQDYLIAQGVIDAYGEGGRADPRLLEFALARLRQLSAHEVGHTLGLAHNYAASTNGRTSVMDYPHPYISLAPVNGGLAVGLDSAYAVGIGAWDKQAIRYGYERFGESRETEGLQTILKENQERDLRYLSDEAARPEGSSSTRAHLWDGGADAVAELKRIGRVRRFALDKFGTRNLAPGRALAELEDVFVPVYLMHRYQVEAAAKTIAGVDYTYSVNGAEPPLVRPVGEERQEAALEAIVATLSPDYLRVPASVTSLIAPRPPGYQRGREQFASYTGVTFDPMAAAESSVELTVGLLLHPERVTRLLEQESRDQGLGAKAFAKTLENAILVRTATPSAASYRAIVAARLFEHAMALANDRTTSAATRAFGQRLAQQIATSGRVRRVNKSLKRHLKARYKQWKRDPTSYKMIPAARIPDGSPI